MTTTAAPPAPHRPRALRTARHDAGCTAAAAVPDRLGATRAAAPAGARLVAQGVRPLVAA